MYRHLLRREQAACRRYVHPALARSTSIGTVRDSTRYCRASKLQEDNVRLQERTRTPRPCLWLLPENSCGLMASDAAVRLRGVVILSGSRNVAWLNLLRSSIGLSSPRDSDDRCVGLGTAARLSSWPPVRKISGFVLRNTTRLLGPSANQSLACFVFEHRAERSVDVFLAGGCRRPGL